NRETVDVRLTKIPRQHKDRLRAIPVIAVHGIEIVFESTDQILPKGISFLRRGADASIERRQVERPLVQSGLLQSRNFHCSAGISKLQGSRRVASAHYNGAGATRSRRIAIPQRGSI